MEIKILKSRQWKSVCYDTQISIAATLKNFLVFAGIIHLSAGVVDVYLTTSSARQISTAIHDHLHFGG